MANSAIPLSIQNLDIQPALNARQQNITNQRNSRIDQLNEQQFAQNTRMNEAQLAGQQQQNKAGQMAIDKAGLQMIATDAKQFDQLVQSDNLQGAIQIGQKIKGTMQRYGMDTSEADNLLRLFNNPPALKQASAQMMQRLAPMSEAIFSDVKNEQGQLVGQRGPDGRLAEIPQGMRPPEQASAMEAYIQGLEVQNQQLTNQRLQGQIQQDQVAGDIRNQEAATKANEATQRQQSIQTEAARAYSLTDSLLNNKSLSAAVGPLDSRLPTFRSGTADFEADIKELENLLTLGNLNRMTGVLSESDIRILANAASGLSSSGSEERTRAKLQEIQSRLSQSPGVMQMLQSQPSQPTPQRQGTVTGTVDRSGALSPEEQAELQSLRSKYGR
jgi:hypothetical protein